MISEHAKSILIDTHRLVVNAVDSVKDNENNILPPWMKTSIGEFNCFMRVCDSHNPRPVPGFLLAFSDL